MAKKQFFLIIDSETTKEDTVADFGAVVCDREGNIHSRCAVLVAGHFKDKELFYNPQDTGFWGKAAAVKREAAYNTMLESGIRMLSSVNAINRWIDNVIGKYDPELTAYNLAFDRDKCQKTGIDLNKFRSSFCLWHAAVGNICQTVKYKQFIIDNHLFRPPTELGNMAYLSNAEVVTGFIQGQITDEPHTAIEDVIGYELPILVHILKKKKWRENIKPYNWRDFQVKDHFKAI
jgi:hypothetical protein